MNRTKDVRESASSVNRCYHQTTKWKNSEFGHEPRWDVVDVNGVHVCRELEHRQEVVRRLGWPVLDDELKRGEQVRWPV